MVCPIRFGISTDATLFYGQVLLPLDFQDISELSHGFFSVTPVDKRYNRGKMSIFHTGSGWIYKDLDRIEYNYEYKLLQKAGKTTMVDVKIMKSVLPFVYFITRLLTVLMF
ncbi:MAG: hypothetical protein RIS64_1745 [Bacteroidota bacterium]|jgi:hypothetical protein